MGAIKVGKMHQQDSLTKWCSVFCGWYPNKKLLEKVLDKWSFFVTTSLVLPKPCWTWSSWVTFAETLWHLSARLLHLWPTCVAQSRLLIFIWALNMTDLSWIDRRDHLKKSLYESCTKKCKLQCYRSNTFSHLILLQWSTMICFQGIKKKKSQWECLFHFSRAVFSRGLQLWAAPLQCTVSSLLFTIIFRTTHARVSDEKAAFTLTVESLAATVGVVCTVGSGAASGGDNLWSPWEGSSTVPILCSRWMTTLWSATSASGFWRAQSFGRQTWRRAPSGMRWTLTRSSGWSWSSG